MQIMTYHQNVQRRNLLIEAAAEAKGILIHATVRRTIELEIVTVIEKGREYGIGTRTKIEKESVIVNVRKVDMKDRSR